MVVPYTCPIIQIVIDSRGGGTLGQIGQELSIEVSKLGRIIRVGVPNTALFKYLKRNL